MISGKRKEKRGLSYILFDDSEIWLFSKCQDEQRLKNVQVICYIPWVTFTEKKIASIEKILFAGIVFSMSVAQCNLKNETVRACILFRNPQKI